MYDPRQADIWSLGLVLLNLLYHRNPWADPSLDDPDFSEYVRDPHAFLADRFEGIGTEVSTFLIDRVFCDILEMDRHTHERRRRVSAGEFGRWSKNLVKMMGEGKRKRASVSEHTFQLTSGVARPTVSARSPTAAPGGSLLSQYAPPHVNEITTSPSGLSDTMSLDVLDELDEPSNPLSLSTFFDRTPLVPSFASPMRLARTLSQDEDSLPSPSFPAPNGDTFRRESIGEGVPVSPLRMFGLAPGRDPSPLLVPLVHPLDSLDSLPLDALATLQLADEVEVGPEVEAEVPGEAAANAKAKRRKRGARKGKAARVAGEISPTPISPGSPLAPLSDEQQRDQMLIDLASASQDLAREVSRTTRSFGTQSTSALVSSSSSATHKGPLLPSAIKKPIKPSGSVFERMKNLVKDGNPDLLAFKQRVEVKNYALGHTSRDPTSSAPAKMQGTTSSSSRIRGGVGNLSSGSVGVNSWGSNSEYGEDGRGREGGVWNSASSRRERLEKRRNPGELSPTTTSIATTTRSSVTSSSEVGGAGGDWRQGSPHSLTATRSYSSSRTPNGIPLYHPPAIELVLPLVLPLPIKPKMRDSSTSTADLVASPPKPFKSPLPSLSLPSPPVLLPALSSSISPTTLNSKSSGEGVKSNKLAKMLQGIGVFNRSQERSVKGE